jgi:hypothetical protein
MARKITWLKLAGFYLRGHLTNTVSATEVNEVSELQQRVEDGWKLIRNTPGIFERVRQSLMKHAVRAVEAQRQHVEHFL